MTLEQVKELSDNELRIKVAELCGWHDFEDEDINTLKYRLMGIHDNLGHKYLHDVPDYCNDLNAMHEAEKLLDTELKQLEYQLNLNYLLGPLIWNLTRATARQCAEAFVLTMWRRQDDF